MEQESEKEYERKVEFINCLINELVERKPYIRDIIDEKLRQQIVNQNVNFSEDKTVQQTTQDKEIKTKEEFKMKSQKKQEKARINKSQQDNQVREQLEKQKDRRERRTLRAKITHILQKEVPHQCNKMCKHSIWSNTVKTRDLEQQIQEIRKKKKLPQLSAGDINPNDKVDKKSGNIEKKDQFIVNPNEDKPLSPREALRTKLTPLQLVEMIEDPLYFILDSDFRNELIDEVAQWEEQEDIGAEDYFDPQIWSQKQVKIFFKRDQNDQIMNKQKKQLGEQEILYKLYRAQIRKEKR